MIQKDGLIFLRLYFLNYTWYVNDLHNIWNRRSYVFTYHRYSSRVMHSLAAASVESKMATMKHKMFCVREFIKTVSATAVQRAFRLRFNRQPATRKSICRWSHQFQQIGCLCKAKAPADHVYQRRTWDEFKRVLSVAHASQPVERAEKLEYRNQLSEVCWGAVYCSSHTAYNWYKLFESIFLNHTVFYPKRKRVKSLLLHLQHTSQRLCNFVVMWWYLV